MEERPPPPDDRRDRRVYVWWGVGFGLLLALGLVCWLVVGPTLEARAVLRETLWDAKATVERLGGPGKAAYKISLYLRLPLEKSETERRRAMLLLGRCGRPAVSTLIRELKEPGPGGAQAEAARALGLIGPEAQEAVEPLITCLKGNSPDFRRAVADALARIGPGARDGVPALVRALAEANTDPQFRYVSAGPEALDSASDLLLKAIGTIGRAAPEVESGVAAMLKDSDPSVRTAAAEALKKIRGEEAAKP